MLVLSRTETESLLDPDALRQAMAVAMADVSAGRVSMPVRTAAGVDDGGQLMVMPAYLPALRTLGAKLVTLFPANHETGHPTHRALVVVSDERTGRPWPCSTVSPSPPPAPPPPRPCRSRSWPGRRPARWPSSAPASRPPGGAPSGPGELAGELGALHAELGELVAGTVALPAGARITLYKSMGIAAQDVAAARLVLDGAAAGLGTTVDL